MKRVVNICRKERGSALLLTLGVMSLALIMAMAFAFSARTETRIAQVNSDLVQARLLAETALNRAMANLVNSTLTFNNNPAMSGRNQGLPFWVHGGDHSDVSESRNSLSALIQNHQDPYLQWLYGTTNVTWNNAGFGTILEKDASFSSGDRVSGRLAMVIWDESGKLDFNEIQAVGAQYRPWGSSMGMYASFDNGYLTSDSSHFLYSLGLGDSDSIAFSKATQFMGQCIQELHGEKIIDHNNIPVMGQIGTALIWNGQNSVAERIQLSSYNQMLALISSVNSGAVNYSSGHCFNIKNMAFYSASEPEAYYAGSGSPTQQYSRFDITGTEYAGYQSAWSGGYWKNVDVDHLASGQTALFDKKMMLADPSKSQYIASTIPYLAGQKQVCANLKDYCDEDDDASVPEFTLDSLTPPDYCGNEKVLYFNEFDFIFKVVLGQLAENKIKCSLYVCPSVELVKIFEQAVKVGDITIRLYGQLKSWANGTGTVVSGNPWKGTAGNKYLEWTFKTKDADGHDVWSVDNESLGYQKKSLPQLLLHEREFDLSGAADDPLKVNELKHYTVEISKVIAVMAGSAENKFYDISYLQKKEDVLQSEADGEIKFNLEDLIQEKIYASTFEVEDPRCNLEMKDGWQLIHKPVIGNVTGANPAETAGVNSIFEPGDGTEFSVKDREKGVDLKTKTFSTAFIRNAPMVSLWELGAIHRGRPYQTINLTKYTDQPLMSDYALGDGAILDQVKIGPVKLSRGKINLNCSNTEVLKYLVSGIDDRSYDSHDWPSVEIDWSKSPDSGDANAPKVTLVFNPASNLTSRGTISNMIEMHSGRFLNDRELEAYAGKIANLLGSRFRRYTVLATGQSMSQFDAQMNNTVFQNLASSGKLVNPTVYTVNGMQRNCSILATRMMLVQLLLDSWEKTFEVVRISDLEE